MSCNLLQGRRKPQQNTVLVVDEAIAVKRRFVYFDQERARECVSQDYIGLQPTFGPDDLKGFSEFLGQIMMKFVIIWVQYNHFSKMDTRLLIDSRSALMGRF